MTWTPDLLDLAVAMWTNGKSAGEISRSKPFLEAKLSRNAVLGKLWRDGHVDRIAQPTRSRQTSRSTKRMDMPHFEPAPTIAPTPALDARGKPITLLTVKAQGQCRWPLWDDQEHRTFQVCGNSCSPHGPYCAYHRAVSEPKPQCRPHVVKEDVAA